MFQAVAEVVGGLFGGTTKPNTVKTEAPASAMTRETAIAQFNAVFKGKGMVAPHG